MPAVLQILDSRLLRRALLAVVFCAAGCAMSESTGRAGVIVPWAGTPASSPLTLLPGLQFETQFVFDDGAASAPSLPVASIDERPEPADDDSPLILALAMSIEPGGASAPPVSSSGQTAGVVAVLLDAPPATDASRSAAAVCRDRSLRLPQPPRNELLDPPKLGA